jgi:hypothetical protein
LRALCEEINEKLESEAMAWPRKTGHTTH